MIIIVREKSSKVPIFLAINATNKKGIYHIVKIITFFDFLENDIFLYELVLDRFKRTNVSRVYSVHYFLIKLNPIDAPKQQLSSVSSN